MTVSKDKTWLIASTTIAPLGSTDLTKQRVLYQLKVEYVAAGWAVEGSSDAAAAGMDDVDRWLDEGDVTWADPGAHSWIVLSKDGEHMCIDCFDTNAPASASYATDIDVCWSRAGFTGGSTTVRPVATDEACLSQMDWGILATSANTNTYQIDRLRSDDDDCLHLFIFRTSATFEAYWSACKVKNPAAGVASEFHLHAIGLSNLDTATFNNGIAGLGTQGWRFLNPLARLMGYAYITATIHASDRLGEQVVAGNDFSSERQPQACGVYSEDQMLQGKVGEMFDMWWADTSFAGTFTNTLDSEDVRVCDELAFAWDSSTPTIPA